MSTNQLPPCIGTKRLVPRSCQLPMTMRIRSLALSLTPHHKWLWSSFHLFAPAQSILWSHHHILFLLWTTCSTMYWLMPMELPAICCCFWWCKIQTVPFSRNQHPQFWSIALVGLCTGLEGERQEFIFLRCLKLQERLHRDTTHIGTQCVVWLKEVSVEGAICRTA